MQEQRESSFSSEEKSIFRMMTGFFTSRVLAVAVELDLFTWLAGRPRGVDEIRGHLGFAERPCRIFLDSLVSLGLLDASGGSYRNSSLAETLLVQGRPDFQGPHIRLFDHLYGACTDLKSALLEDRPTSTDYTYFFDGEERAVSRYSGLMHDSSLVPALTLPQYWDFSESACVLDVGGGYGRLCLTLTSQHPELETILFDLPEVCARTRTLLAEHPHLAARIRLHPGDFLRDDLPRGADTIVLMRIMHDWPREQACRLLRRAFEALPSGGRLLIYETLRDQGPSPGDAAFISLLLLLISPGGECRSFPELHAWLREVGFGRIELVPTVYFYGLVAAEKP